MALFELTNGGDPIDKLSVLRFRKQMAEDARTMGPAEFSRKYGSLSKDDKKTYLPNATWDTAATYDFFKQQDPASFTKLIGIEEKKAKIRTEENDKLTQQAMGIAEKLKPVVQSFSTINSIKGEAKKKYGYNPDEVVDPVQVVTDAMVMEANQRIKDQKGIGLSQDPKNDMTCIAGVCTLAANQGVDFSSMKGMPGVVKDAQGRYIPQYNPTFSSAVNKTGFEELSKGEKPRKGDIVQYFKAEGSMGQLVPKHMELVTSGALPIFGKGENFETFNNYGLYSSNLYNLGSEPGDTPGREVRDLSKRQDGTFSSGGWNEIKFYRMKPETAEKAVAKTRPDVAAKVEAKRNFEGSDDFKKFQSAQQQYQSGVGQNVLGQDQGLMMEIVEGVGGKFLADRAGLKKSLLTKAKNPKLVELVIDQLYDREL